MRRDDPSRVDDRREQLFRVDLDSDAVVGAVGRAVGVVEAESQRVGVLGRADGAGGVAGDCVVRHVNPHHVVRERRRGVRVRRGARRRVRRRRRALYTHPAYARSTTIQRLYI